MKKIILGLIPFFICILSASAQLVQKSDKLFGGSFNAYFFNSNPASSTLSNNNSNVGITPSFSFAIKSDLVLGISGGISYQHSKDQNNNGLQKQNSFSFSPSMFLRKYKLLQRQFGIYFDNAIGGNFYFQKDFYSNPDVVTKTWSNGVFYNFTPGVFYRFSDRLFGEGSIGNGFFSYQKTNGGSKSFSAGVSFLQYFELGIKYKISRRKS